MGHAKGNDSNIYFSEGAFEVSTNDHKTRQATWQVVNMHIKLSWDVVLSRGKCVTIGGFKRG